MSEPIKMPALGESVTDGTVNAWLKQVGETVEEGEPLLEVSTDKVDTEVPSPISGVLESIEVAEDETVEVGTILGYIGDGSGASSAASTHEPAQTEAPTPAGDPSPTEQVQQAAGGTGVEVKMPALGESVTDGTVNSWLKEVGDDVEEGEPLLEVSTDKVDTEVPAPASGKLTQILVTEDATVEVGAVLAIIGGEVPASSNEPDVAPVPAEPAAPAAPATPAPAAPAPAAPAATPVTAPAGSEDAYVTPIVRKLAKDLGVDLSTVAGTGVGGRVRRQDVEAAAEAAKAAQASAAPVASAPATPAPANAGSVKADLAKKAAEATSLRGTRQKMSGLRKTISKRMVESLQVSAQLTTVMEVDVTKIVALRAKAKDGFNAREGVKLTYLPFFVQAAAEALKAHPKLNASIEGNEVVYHDVEHVGLAVDTPKGLFVPVIKNAGDLNIAGIAKQIADLASRTRDGKIGAEEMAGSTFTITNTGSIGALFDTPIINQPNVAILGTGAIFKTPAVIKDQDGNDVIQVRSKCYLAISYDHRLVDGADASRFLRDVKLRLEEADFAGELGL
ncbi:2-oxoglutarate dehydrogenase, E2 component, dihydrolipoamide succinyltransferase [Arcanobacterium canis]|uniref:Dihydrolipoamide acetyltransferase component of pyruvate dehydrogenase complex n=1 Tax=Arcanobacterium canis TaxID=999183 RepID=A0ABY8FW37_9ACTO|nr:2-oxoglutarate dehydrogenase, E2 component, dihydrolipoamide succinyltransferase [Arcanobacterium canis]WFM82734.1 2-oxoglutarate dehydrogenase, E2 component, dihydrolipoamide succinyltransferase [Arcanobacterium canis]